MSDSMPVSDVARPAKVRLWFLLAAVVLLACVYLVVEAQDKKAPLLIVVMAGQSNMDGRVHRRDLPVELRAPQEDVRFYFADRWTTLRPGSSRNPSPPDGFGPEITFGRGLADSLASRSVAIIKCSAGGSSLAEEWFPETGPYYKRMIDSVRLATSTLQAQGLSHEIIGFVWMQGEKDALTKHQAEDYEANLKLLIQRVRHDLGNAELPFVLGQVKSPYKPFVKRVRRAQEAAARDIPLVRLVPTADLPLMDPDHYDAEGQMELGRRFAKALLSLLHLK